jgi:hypothetical protein
VDLVALSDVDWQHENLLQVSLSSFLVSRIRPKRLLASYSTPLPRGLVFSKACKRARRQVFEFKRLKASVFEKKGLTSGWVMIIYKI